MKNRVYKSEAGRRQVETFYQNLLKKYPGEIEQIYLPTPAGKTHILRFGDRANPPIIMLHGTSSNSASWLGNVHDFTDRFCVYCLDIPGEPGLSEPIRMKLASNLPGKWLSSVFNGLKIDKAAFVTISLGSWFALDFAVKNPGKITVLSMLTTSGVVPAKSSFIFKAVFYMMMGKTGQKLLNKAIYHKIIVPPEVLEFQSIVSRYFIPLTEFIPIFSDEQLQTIDFPVQYFGGKCDNLLDSTQTGERLKRFIPQAEINILPDIGHVIIDRFDRITEFLIKHSF